KQRLICRTDRGIRVSDIKTGKVLWDVTHNDRQFPAAVSNDGKWLGAWSYAPGEMRAHLLPLQQKRDARQFTLPGEYGAHVAFSPDNRYFAGVSHLSRKYDRAFVRIWKIADGSEVASWEIPGRAIQQLAFSPDGRMLAAGDAKGHLSFWELLTRKERH